MSMTSIFLALIVLVIGAIWISLPLLTRQRAVTTRQQTLARQRDYLLVLYEQVMSSIRDLDDDFATGKIAQVDYNTERERWAERGVQVLAALDQAGIAPANARNEAQRAAAEANASAPEAIDDAIEAAVAQYLRTAKSS